MSTTKSPSPPKSLFSRICNNHTISVIMYGVLSLHYFGLLVPLLWISQFTIPVSISTYVAVTVALGVMTYLTVNTDPVDDAVTCKELNKSPEYGVKISYCHACKVDVHSSSRHCRYCDKCVIGFDHHCSWLNVCVGSKNYAHFVSTCSLITAMITISMALCIAYVVEFLVDPQGDFFQRYQVSMLRPYMTFQAVLALLVISLFLLLPFALSLYHIIGFHIMLTFRGMTTYDYVVEKHRQARMELTAKTKRGSDSTTAQVDAQAETATSAPEPTAEA